MLYLVRALSVLRLSVFICAVLGTFLWSRGTETADNNKDGSGGSGGDGGGGGGGGGGSSSSGSGSGGTEPTTITTGAKQGRLLDTATVSGTEKATIKLKVGALFDMRAKHLTDVFQHALDRHNSEQLSPPEDIFLVGSRPEESEEERLGGRKEDPVRFIFEPVITFVDVTDSFAVSNAMCDLIAHDVIAIVGITNASSLPTIQSYSATFHVPFLSLGSSQNVTSSAPFQLSLRPPVMTAVVELLQLQGCSSALYLYDSDEGLMRIQDLFQAINMRELYVELDVRRIGDKAQVTELFKIIGSLHPRREICLVLDLERLDTVAIINRFADEASTVKDVILVTLDAEIVLHTVMVATHRRPTHFNVSGLQLVPLHQPLQAVYVYPTNNFHPHKTIHRWPTTSPSTSPSRSGDNSKGHSAEPHHKVSADDPDLEEEGTRDPDDDETGGELDRSFSRDSKHHGRGGSTGTTHSEQTHTTAASSTSNVDKDSPLSSTSASSSWKHHPASQQQRSQWAEYNSESSDSTSPTDAPNSPKTSNFPKTGWQSQQQQQQYRHPSSEDSSQIVRSSEALITDCLRVLTTALGDLWDTMGDVFRGSGVDSQEDISIKCTNFVVEKKQHGADLMEALKLVHIQGETRYISFDTSGRRDDFTLSILSVRAGSRLIRHEGDWSSVSGVTSRAWSYDGVKSYTIFGNMSNQAGRKVLLGVME